MWAYRHFDCAVAQLGKPLLRHPQFRRRASPEQIRRGGGNHQEVSVKIRKALPDFFRIQPLELGIDEECVVPCFVHLVVSKQQFERVVRLLAAEVG